MKKLIYFLICYWIRWNSFWEFDYNLCNERRNVRRYYGRNGYPIWEFTATMKSAYIIQTLLRQFEKDLWNGTFVTEWKDGSNWVSVPAPWWIRMKLKEKRQVTI